MTDVLPFPRHSEMRFGERTDISYAGLFKYAPFRNLLGYLQAKTEDGRLAARSDIDPSELKDLLRFLFIWDIEQDENGLVTDAIIRLEGTEIVNLYGEVTGQSWHSYPDEAASKRAFWACQKLIEQRCPHGYTVRGITEEKQYVDLSVLYIPMSKDGIIIDQVLGCICLKATP